MSGLPKRAATDFKLELAEKDERHRLTFDTPGG